MIAIKRMKPYMLHYHAHELAIRKGDKVTVADKDFDF